jgi:hypothetical protein
LTFSLNLDEVAQVRYDWSAHTLKVSVDDEILRACDCRISAITVINVARTGQQARSAAKRLLQRVIRVKDAPELHASGQKDDQYRNLECQLKCRLTAL